MSAPDITNRACDYARAGLLVFPVGMRPDDEGKRHKRPLPGFSWKERATTTIAQVVEDFTEAIEMFGEGDVGVAWACGLDGYLALDLDVDDEPDWWGEVRPYAAINTTARGEHLVCRFPDDLVPGNSTDRFPSAGWGEMRGFGGFIVIDGPDRPGFDAKHLEGLVPFGHPEWLVPAGDTAEVATLARVEAFRAEHSEAILPGALGGIESYLAGFSPGGSRADGRSYPAARHEALIAASCWVARESAAGYFSATDGIDVLRRWWSKIMSSEPTRRDGREFPAAVAWGICQADHDPERIAELRERASADPGRFFGKNGLLHRSLRDAVLADGPIVAGVGKTLWHCCDGVYLSGGEDIIRRRCSDLLGERFRKTHAEGIVADIAASPMTITDRQPARWINVRNGLLDWHTFTLEAHDPAVASTYQLAVDWNPHASCPTVDEWVAQVVPDDAVDLLWEVLGTAIYSDQPFHRAVLLLDRGRNGKGTFLRLATALIGERHVSAVTLQMLGELRFAAASLFGKVANIAGDLDARSITRTDVFKAATGGDLIEAEHKYGAAFTFRNRATMLFSANELPGSADCTDGFFSRWVVIPFDRLQIAPGKEDPKIEAKMMTELEGVLVRAVEGLRRAMSRGGYDTPASVVDASADYRETADPMIAFVDECLDITNDHDDKVERNLAYEKYTGWCRDTGHHPLYRNRVWSHLGSVRPDIGIKHKSVGKRYLTGVKLKKTNSGLSEFTE